MPSQLKTDARFDEPIGIEDVRDLAGMKVWLREYLRSDTEKKNKLKRDYEAVDLGSVVTEVIRQSASGGSSGSSVKVEANYGVYSAGAGGDQPVPYSGPHGPFTDLNYGLMIMTYTEDSPGIRNAIAYTLKSWGLNNFVVNVPEACEIWYLALKVS